MLYFCQGGSCDWFIGEVGDVRGTVGLFLACFEGAAWSLASDVVEKKEEVHLNGVRAGILARGLRISLPWSICVWVIIVLLRSVPVESLVGVPVPGEVSIGGET